MARLARVVIAGCPHHVTQRGNRREAVFFSDADRRQYLKLLAEQAKRYNLEVWAYCLMTNHVHLVVVPAREQSLALTMQNVSSQYASWVNHCHGLSGHLWQGRFYSTPLDEWHMWAAVRYAERNPVRAGIVEQAWDYSWSSARRHCGWLSAHDLLSGSLEKNVPGGDWQVFLQNEDDPGVAVLRKNTRTGRPCGTAEFIARIQEICGRSLSRWGQST